MKPTLYLMMGLPGAGKTTAAKALESITKAIRLSSDEARVMLWPKPEFSEEEHQALYEYLDDQTLKLLQIGKSVIYDANLNRYEHRQEKYVLASQLGAEVQLLWVKTTRELAKNRRLEETSHHSLVPDHEDPAIMFERIADVIEEPKENERYIELNGTKITEEYLKTKLNLQ